MKTKSVGLLITLYVLLTATICEDVFEGPVFEPKVVGIELENLDNSGMYSVVGDDSIRKEAYVIGVRFKVLEEANPDDTIYYSERHHYIAIKKQYIYCNTDFNDDVQAGSEVSDFFATQERNSDKYNRLLILRKIPKAGIHSFRVKYELDSAKIIEINTVPIKLY